MTAPVPGGQYNCPCTRGLVRMSLPGGWYNCPCTRGGGPLPLCKGPLSPYTMASAPPPLCVGVCGCVELSVSGLSASMFYMTIRS